MIKENKLVILWLGSNHFTKQTHCYLIKNILQWNTQANVSRESFLHFWIFFSFGFPNFSHNQLKSPQHCTHKNYQIITLLTVLTNQALVKQHSRRILSCGRHSELQQRGLKIRWKINSEKKFWHIHCLKAYDILFYPSQIWKIQLHWEVCSL